MLLLKKFMYIPCRRDLEHASQDESLLLEGDIGGGLVLQRQITIPKDDPKVIQIDSNIVGRKVGAGSGGYSRFVHSSFPSLLLFEVSEFLSSQLVEIGELLQLESWR